MDEIVEGDVVAAMEFCAVMKSSAVGTERDRDECGSSGLVAVLVPRRDGDLDRVAEGPGGIFGSASQFGVPEIRDLITDGGDAVGSGAKVVEMHLLDRIRGGIENMSGPERTGDVATPAFQLGGHATIEDTERVKVELRN